MNSCVCGRSATPWIVEQPKAHTSEYISREWKVLRAQVAKTLTLRVGENATIVVTHAAIRIPFTRFAQLTGATWVDVCKEV